VAAVTQRLAVLLAAGVAPGQAWGYLAAARSSAVVARVADDPASAAEVLAAAGGDRLEREAWRGLGAAWWVAIASGAPLAPSLRSYARSLRSLAQAQREARVALAAPVATARMVMALPGVGILFGAALGFDTLGTLLGTAPGWGCLVIGAALMLAAVRWNRRLLRAAQPRDAAPGLVCDLIAIAMSGGGSLGRARALVDDAVLRFGLGDPGAEVDEVLELARSAGVPAGELLRAEADERRRDARSDAQERAAALSVRLMLPLGLCVLPAFMVLGVMPMLVAVVSSTVGSF
jgi:tight adherence protein B